MPAARWPLEWTSSSLYQPHRQDQTVRHLRWPPRRKASVWCLSVCPVWHIFKRTPQGAPSTTRPAYVSVVLCEADTVVSLLQTRPIGLHCVPPKRPPFYFLIALSQINRFNDFGELNPEKISHKILLTCPPHLSDVATLPWEIQKVIFTVLFLLLII